MKAQNGRYAWMVKIGERGQFVIPKEARDLFDLQPGDEILVLGDKERGIAILPKEKQQAAIGVLQHDPRPSYQRTPDRVYGLSFAGFDIRFTVADDVLTVQAVEKI